MAAAREERRGRRWAVWALVTSFLLDKRGRESGNRTRFDVVFPLSLSVYLFFYLSIFLGGEGYSFICVCTGALFYIYSIEITHRKKSYIWNPCLFCFFFLPMVYCTSKSRTVQTDAIKRAIFSNKAESRATSYLGEAPRSFCNCKAESVTKALWTLDWMSKWLS